MSEPAFRHLLDIEDLGGRDGIDEVMRLTD